MHARRRSHAALLLAGLLLAGCGGDSSEEGFGDEASAAADQGTVTIAGQDFTGGQVMTQLYAKLLESEGFTAKVKLVSTRDLYMPELQSGRVQVLAARHAPFARLVEPRQELADAHVDAVAEADVAAGAAGDVVLVRPFPPARIAVRRAQEHEHLLALAHLDAAHLHRASGGAEEGLHR